MQNIGLNLRTFGCIFDAIKRVQKYWTLIKNIEFFVWQNLFGLMMK